MIKKFKEVMQLSGEIEGVKENIGKGIEEIDKFKEDMKNIQKEFKEKIDIYEEANKKMLVDKQVSLEKINKIGDEFQRELNDFKVLKTKLKTDIVEKVSSEIRNELDVYIRNVKEKVDMLNNVVKEIKATSENSAEMVECLNNIREISKGIKKEDFELGKHAEMLRRNDKEKLELLRKIDTLERLIAKQRRNS